MKVNCNIITFKKKVSFTSCFPRFSSLMEVQDQHGGFPRSICNPKKKYIFAWISNLELNFEKTIHNN